MEEQRCITPAVRRTVSPKSPSRSTSGSPLDDKSAILGSVERTSPEPNCAICLGKLQNKSFTNSCLHQYCFTCLLEWSKVKAECPLCKQGFQSIIHNVRSIEDYDQYDLLSNNTSSFPNWEEPRFRYRTTVAGNRHRFRVESTIPIVLQPIPPARRPQRTPWTRSRRQIATAEFRRSIYERNLWVMPLDDVTGRYRECSPTFYRANPAQLHRLYPWLSREIGVLLQNANRLALVLETLMSMLQYHSINSHPVRNYLRTTLNERHVDHFIHEFYTFARSPYDMIGFDETAEYGPHDAHTIEIVPSPPRSVIDGDIDVVVISSDHTDEDSEVNVEDSDDTPSLFSSSSRSLRSHGNTSAQVTDTTADVRIPETHILSDSDDCTIVCTVKPLHLRTPEIIELDSDENIIEETERSPERVESRTCDAASSSRHTLDVENPVASTSGYQCDSLKSVASFCNLPYSEKKSRARQHKKKKTYSSRSKARTSKRSTKVKHSRSRSCSSSTSSSCCCSESSPKYKSRTRRHRHHIDSSSDSPVRQHRAPRNYSRKLDYSSSSDSSFMYSPIRHGKTRTSNLSKLSFSSDSSCRSPERRHSFREMEDTRYSGRSSVEDYSYPLSARMSSNNTPYSSDDDSDFHKEQKPKLRSIVIPKNSHTSQGKSVEYPSTSSSSSSRRHEISQNFWSTMSHSHKSKHKYYRNEKKRRRKETYSSSSSDDFMRNPKKKSGKSVIYSDSD